jgi:hypothetical protein
LKVVQKDIYFKFFKKELVDAVSRQDLKKVLTYLALSKTEDLNLSDCLLDSKNCLHIAAQKSNIVIMQLLIWVK